MDFSSAFRIIVLKSSTGGSMWGWGASQPALRPSALVSPRVVKLLNYVDETSLISLIRDSNESAYKMGSRIATLLVQSEPPELNLLKTGDILQIESEVESISTFLFLCTNLVKNIILILILIRISKICFWNRAVWYKVPLLWNNLLVQGRLLYLCLCLRENLKTNLFDKTCI